MNRDQYIKRELEKLDLQYVSIDAGFRRSLVDVFKHPALWGEYDTAIKNGLLECAASLKTFNLQLPAGLDWTMIKAMIWVETGGPNSYNNAWFENPMQIGVLGKDGKPLDPGAQVVAEAREKVPFLLPKSQYPDMTVKAIATNRWVNIKAGIAYLLNRLAKAEVDNDKSNPVGRKIVGWKSITPETLASYNGHGDARYADKIRYSLAIMRIAREAEFMR